MHFSILYVIIINDFKYNTFILCTIYIHTSSIRVCAKNFIAHTRICKMVVNCNTNPYTFIFSYKLPSNWRARAIQHFETLYIFSGRSLGQNDKKVWIIFQAV